MAHRGDIAAYDAQGNLSLIIEAKSKVGTDAGWAAGMRRNMLAHGLIRKTKYFLLALPDRFYLWDNPAAPPEDKPAYEIDPAPLLEPYLKSAKLRPEELSPAGFELVLLSWFTSLLGNESLAADLRKGNAWLTESGLLESVQHGRVVLEAA